VRRPVVDETEELDDELFRIRVRAAVAPGREWLAQEFLPSLVAERAEEGLVVHGPVVTAVDDHATRRFARAAWTGTGRRAAFLWGHGQRGHAPEPGTGTWPRGTVDEAVQYPRPASTWSTFVSSQPSSSARCGSRASVPWTSVAHQARPTASSTSSPGEIPSAGQ
jgi:hypothetical protein